MKRSLFPVFLAFFGILLSSCSSPTDIQDSAYNSLSKGENHDFFSKEDIEVLNACFDYRLGGVSNEILMIYESSLSYPISDYVIDTGALYPTPLVNTFNKLNEKSCYYGDSFLGIKYDYRYFDRETCAKMSESSDDGTAFWESFRSLYPLSSSGYFLFSKIAFNERRTHAILFFMNLIGPTAGEGGYMALKKTCGKWIVQDYTVIWRS